MSKETCVYEKRPTKETGVYEKRPTKGTCIYEKRPTKETYKRDLCIWKEALRYEIGYVKRDWCIWKETYQKGVQKRPTKEAYWLLSQESVCLFCRSQKSTIETYKRDILNPEKRPTKQTYWILKRDLQKRLTKETYKKDILIPILWESAMDWGVEMSWGRRLEGWYAKEYIYQKRPVYMKRDPRKRLTRETYKRDLQNRPTGCLVAFCGKAQWFGGSKYRRKGNMCFKRDLCKVKETYKRDLQKRPTKETYKRNQQRDQQKGLAEVQGRFRHWGMERDLYKVKKSKRDLYKVT